MNAERLARLILALLLAAVFVIGLVVLIPRPNEVSLHARMVERGGWSQDMLHAKVGQPLRLRITSDDVLHGFVIAQSGQAPIDLKPGEWVNLNLTFDRPGTYVFYCTRWCGPRHHEIRGLIVVSADPIP